MEGFSYTIGLLAGRATSEALAARLAKARLPFCQDGCGEPSGVISVGPDGSYQYRCVRCETIR